MDIHHETLVLERALDAPPARVFSAYVDTKAREKWSAPSPTTEVRIDHADVRTGGQETGRCGTTGDLRWTLKLNYHRVIQDSQITFTEELWEGEVILTVALITFDLRDLDQGRTLLRLTDQITSFVGPEAVSGQREGYAAALANLDQHLGSSA